MRLIYTILALLTAASLLAQPTLKPSIGLSSLPNDSDPICAFTPYTGSFDAAGYAIADTVNDFTLYTTTGVPVNLQTVLGQGKPVLLVGGSYTCPVFRGKIATLNSMASIYAGQLEIYVVYTMEAHPTTPSPYSGQVWITSSNQQNGILHPQPTTYGERKALIDTLLASYTISPEILVDGPCNEWLSTYGPAPNNAYLIDTTGIVYEKQGWYHKLPDDMYCEIDSLLGTNSGLCNANGNNGLFTFSYVNDTIEYGASGATLGVHAQLTNTSSTDNVIVDIIRMSVDVPSLWLTAMCVDVCLPTGTDTTQVTIPPNMTQDFIFYLYSDPSQDSIGHGRIGFRNAMNNQNKMIRKFWGQTSKATAVSSLKKEAVQAYVYPNPSDGLFYLHTERAFEGTIEVVDLNGRKVLDLGDQSWSNGAALNLRPLNPGIYILHFSTKEARFYQKVVISI